VSHQTAESQTTDAGVVLVAVDVAPTAEIVLEKAAEQARLAGVPLYLLHVEPPEPDFAGYGPGPQQVRDNVAQDAIVHHRVMFAWAEKLRASGLDANALVIQGPTVEKILSESERLNARLLVAGCHGHGKMYHLLMGSTSEGLIRGTKRPILLVPVKPA